MDAPDPTLLRLYGETPPPGQEPLASRFDPAEEAADLRALGEAKAWLDARPRLRPSADVFEAVLRAAAHGSPAGVPEPGVRHDRGPVRPARRLRRAWALVGAACTLAAGFFGAVNLPSGGTSAPPAPVVASAPSPAPSASEVAAAAPVELPTPAPAPEPAPRAEAVAVVPASPAPTAPEARPEPSWSDADAAARVATAEARAARLRARLDSTLWDTPPAAPPLALPAPSGAGRFSSASNSKQ